MAATVKTLLEHHGELYWGTRKANPGYCYGLALDVGADGLAAELVYVMSDLDENDEPLVTPETLVSCFTVNDLEDNGIILSNNLDGYYLPSSKEEKDRCVDSLRRRAAEILEAADAIEKAEW